jgi:hypothetical protein
MKTKYLNSLAVGEGVAGYAAELGLVLVGLLRFVLLELQELLLQGLHVGVGVEQARPERVVRAVERVELVVERGLRVVLVAWTDPEDAICVYTAIKT